MKKCFLRAFAATGIALFSQAFFISSATADTLKILTTGAFKQVVVAVAADFEKRTGHKVDIQNYTAYAGAVRANTPKKDLANTFLQLFVSNPGKSIIREKGMMA